MVLSVTFVLAGGESEDAIRIQDEIALYEDDKQEYNGQMKATPYLIPLAVRVAL